MHPFTPIFDAHKGICAVFLITPDESTAMAASREPEGKPVCPVFNLNRIFHDSTHLLAGTNRLELTYGKNLITALPLPKEWVLVVEHTSPLTKALEGDLLRAARPLPTADAQDTLRILTPGLLASSPLGKPIATCKNFFQEAQGEKSAKPFLAAFNSWIDEEDPSPAGLPRLIALLEEKIASVDKRRLFSDNVKEILNDAHEGETMP